ncbi:MAG: tetratricopeptide repeat protein [Alphaproteobacteria bacterium]|nr:tetratricopeptide repeat protein [Alphaproteobacteria bacterium]
MIWRFYPAVLAAALISVLAGPARSQPMNDGEACLEGSGRAHLDEAYCRRALGMPDLPGVQRAALLTARAAALARLGESGAAEAELGHALALNPDSAQAFLLRALIRRGAGEVPYPVILADLNRAIALNPYFVRALAQRGAMYLQGGDWAAALADFDQALSLRPQSSPALFFKGVLRFHQGRFAQAEVLFRRVLALSPVQHPIAALWLASAAGRRGNSGAAALAHYLWWWQDGLWPAPLLQLWTGAANVDDVAAAMAEADDGIRAQGAFFLAQWYLAQGDDSAARAWMEQARRLAKPFMPEAIVAGGPHSE